MTSHSIPHNGVFRQVSLYQIPRLDELSETQYTAFELYDQGFNVFPQPLGKKGGYPWKSLQYIRLDRNHTRYGIGALFAGKCNLAIMCGKTSDNLFVIDCETKDSFSYHIQQIKARNIPLWAVETGRGGHIYLRCDSGEVENIQFGDTEIKGRNGYVLAPPSIHPSGARYQWIAQESKTVPTVSIEQIDWLKNANGKTIKLDVIAPSQPSQIKEYKLYDQQSRLSRQTKDYLQNGMSIPEGSRNNRLFSAACDLAGNKYTLDEASRLLTPIAISSGLVESEVNATLQSAFSSHREPARKHSTDIQKDQGWRYAMLFASQVDWEGRSANSLHMVFLALIERARVSANENGVFRASIRELAVMAQLGTATILKYMDILKSRKWIILCGKDKSSHASLWCFSSALLEKGKAVELKMDTLPLSPPWLRFSVSVFNSLDSAERGALGKGGVYLYKVMASLSSPMMPSQLARVAGMSVNRVNYALGKLKQYDLVVRDSNGWSIIRMDDTELDERVVSGSSIKGRGRRRRQRYTRERALYAGRLIYVARLRHERGQFFMRVNEFERIISCFSVFEAQYDIVDDPLLTTALELGGVVMGCSKTLRDVLETLFLE